MQSLISVIIPVYNVERYLHQCVDSVLTQTYTNLEIILVDDGSPDTSPDICDEYAQKDKRIKVIHKDNGGLSSARNAGLDVATGNFIYFLDSDDYIGENTIADLHQQFLCNPNIAIVVGYFSSVINDSIEPYKNSWIFEKAKLIEPSEFAIRMLSEESNFASTAKLYKKEIFQNIRFQINKKNEDTLFIGDLIPIIEKKQYKCLDIPLYTYFYRQHENSICHSQSSPLEIHVIANYENLIQKFIGRKDIVQILEHKKYDLVINLQVKLFKQKEYNEYLFISNQKKLHEIPFIFVLRTKPLVTFVYFLFMRYFPRILKFLHRVHSRQRP